MYNSYFKPLIVLLLCAVSFSWIRCEVDPEATPNQEINEEVLLDLEKQLRQIKSELKTKQTSKGNFYEAATFEIRKEGDRFIVDQVAYLDAFQYGFIQGLLGESQQDFFSFKQNMGGIKISCEATGAISECPEQSGIGAGLRQAKCVADAVQACLDAGGCAEICSIEGLVQQ